MAVRQISLLLVLVACWLLGQPAPEAAALSAARGLTTLADRLGAPIREVQYRGFGFRAPIYRAPPPVYRQPPRPPPVFRPPPRQPGPYTRSAPGARGPAVARPGPSRPPVLGPTQRPTVLATPGRSLGTAGAKAGPAATPLTQAQKSAMQTRLGNLPKQVGSGGGAGSSAGKPPGSGVVGPPGGRPRLTPIFNRAATQTGGPATKLSQGQYKKIAAVATEPRSQLVRKASSLLNTAKVQNFRKVVAYTNSVKGDSTAYVRFERRPGALVLTNINSGSLGRGYGSALVSQAIRLNNLPLGKKLVLENVINKPTLQAYKSGVRPENTLIGKMAMRAMADLGKKPRSMTFVERDGKVDIHVEL